MGRNGVCPGVGHILLIIGTTFQKELGDWQEVRANASLWCHLERRGTSGFVHRIEKPEERLRVCSSGACACVFLPVSVYVTLYMPIHKCESAV